MWKVLLVTALVTASLDPATWISQSLNVIGNSTLKNITLPGSHDSCSFWLGPAPMPDELPDIWDIFFKIAEEESKDAYEIARAWSRTQDQDLLYQMRQGMRYIDLRAGWNRTTKSWVAYHFLQGESVNSMLLNISAFLNQYPKEIAVIEISHFLGDPTTADILQLRNLVYTVLGQFLYQTDLSFNFTINDMVNSGKRALVTMEQEYDNQGIWPPGAIYNTYANTPDLSQMIAFNNATVKQFMDSSWPGQLFKVSWTLTAYTKTVEDMFLPFHPHTLIELADEANKALPSFWTNMKRYGWRTGNILIIDHCQKSEIMNVVWAMNGLNAE